MGNELQCTCRWDKRKSTGKALLETDELLFRGDFRLAVAFKDMKSLAAAEGELRFDSPQGKVALSLGTAAAKWADKILHPPTRLDKLGVKPGSAVAIVGLEDAGFREELALAKAEIVSPKSSAVSDVLFFGSETRADLKKLRSLKASIKPAGAVWVIYPKGMKTITQADVMAAGHEAGLVDVKVARFSQRQTALKFVIPVAERG